VIVADRADRVEAAQIVLIGRVRAVPGDDVERRMIDRRRPQRTAEFGDQFEVPGEVLVPRDRRLEIARLGKSVGADRPEIRQAQRRAEILAHIAARGAVRQLDAKAQAARQDGDLQRFDVQDAEFRQQPQPPLLRHHQHFRIGVVEIAPAHRPVGDVPVDRAAACAAAEPVPATVNRPSTKSSASAGRELAGGSSAGGSGDRRPRRSPRASAAAMGAKAPCTAAGRIRYSQERRLSWRGTVKAVPDHCSAYSP
jgi:hypothetical protein